MRYEDPNTKEFDTSLIRTPYRGMGRELREIWRMQIEYNRKQQEENDMIGVDVTEELKDLMETYCNSEERLRNRETLIFEGLLFHMRSFLTARDERDAISTKIESLKNKLEQGAQCDGCCEEEGEE